MVAMDAVLRGMVHAALRAIGSTLDGMVLMCLAPSSSSSSSSSSARSLACAPLAAVLAAVDEAAQRGRGPGEGVCLVRRRHGRGRRVDSCFKGARFCWCVIMSCHHVVSSCRAARGEQAPERAQRRAQRADACCCCAARMLAIYACQMRLRLRRTARAHPSMLLTAIKLHRSGTEA